MAGALRFQQQSKAWASKLEAESRHESLSLRTKATHIQPKLGHSTSEQHPRHDFSFKEKTKDAALNSSEFLSLRLWLCERIQGHGIQLLSIVCGPLSTKMQGCSTSFQAGSHASAIFSQAKYGAGDWGCQTDSKAGALSSRRDPRVGHHRIHHQNPRLQH